MEAVCVLTNGQSGRDGSDNSTGHACSPSQQSSTGLRQALHS
jgi:hypothetical protein